MVYIYVLKSIKTGIHYVGMTKNLENRLKEHNAGKTKFTKGHIPWELVYSETSTDFAEGREREKYLKSSAGKKWLKSKDKDSKYLVNQTHKKTLIYISL